MNNPRDEPERKRENVRVVCIVLADKYDHHTTIGGESFTNNLHDILRSYGLKTTEIYGVMQVVIGNLDLSVDA